MFSLNRIKLLEDFKISNERKKKKRKKTLSVIKFTWVFTHIFKKFHDVPIQKAMSNSREVTLNILLEEFTVHE